MRAEEKEECVGEAQFVVFENQNKEFMVMGVPIAQGSFVNRTFLKEEWRGMRNQDLQEKSGLSDIVFVHATGFLGVAKSLETAIKMAELSLPQ
jgi:uncharacterized UPF0160 family protein